MITFFLNTKTNMLNVRMNAQGANKLRSCFKFPFYIRPNGNNSFTSTIYLSNYSYEYCMDKIYPVLDEHATVFI